MAESTKPAKPEAAKPEKKAEAKRKMLTPAERVAKLEADLAEARAKAEAKAKAKAGELTEKREKLTAKIVELQKQVDTINAELSALGVSTDDETEADNVVPMAKSEG